MTTIALPGTLPDGLTARALTMADARSVFEVIAAQEQHDIGSVEIDAADIVADWQRPSFDVTSQTMGVFDGEALVAYGEFSGGQRSDAAVHPAYRGRGIGTVVAGWIRDTARAGGARVIGMPTPQGSAGDRLLESMGYFVRWESWVLELPQGREIAAQPLPEGYEIRDAVSDVERRAACEVVEDAFLEWSDRPRRSYEDFVATTVQRPGFEPWNLRVVRDVADDAVVGVCFVDLSGEACYVDILAVRRDRRGLGLARAMLADAFANGRAHGATRSELSTDSRTGALGLYERVGMVVTSTWLHRAVNL